MIVKCTDKLVYYESFLINEVGHKQDEYIYDNIHDILVEKNKLESKFEQHNKVFEKKQIQDIFQLHTKIVTKLSHPFTIKLGYQIKTVISLESISSIITVTYLLYNTDIDTEDPIDYQFFVFDTTRDILNVEVINKEILNDIEYYKSRRIILNDVSNLDKVQFNCCSAAKLLHEVISHPLEDDHYAQNNLVDLNKICFNSNLTVIENYDLLREFDDKKQPIQKNIALIKDGVYTKKLLSSSTGNTYIDYFSERKDPIIRTVSCLFEINNTTDIYDSLPYLEVVQIESGQYNAKTNTIMICISKSIMHWNENKQEKVAPFYLEMSINILLECTLYRVGDYETQHSLCFKRGGIQHVIIRTPAIMITDLNRSIIKYGGLNND